MAKRTHDVVTFDIAEVTNEPVAAGCPRGEEVWRDLRQVLDRRPKHSATIIDATHTIAMDYNFCASAFGPIQNLVTKNAFQYRYILFRIIIEADRNHLCHGMLKYRSPNYLGKDVPTDFLNSGIYLSFIDGKNSVSCAGKLSNSQNAVLTAVNTSVAVTAEKLAAGLKISVEKAVGRLKFLTQKRLIVAPRDEGSRSLTYSSLRVFLKE